MKDAQKQQLIETSWNMHNEVEQAYLQDSAQKGDSLWREKQRLLLADMALHLLQTALTPGDIQQDKLKNNLHAILTICDQFLPHAQLKDATKKFYITGGIDE